MHPAELHALNVAHYGEEYIVVFKPANVDYFITSSTLAPERTRDIIQDIANRIGLIIKLDEPGTED